MIHKPSGGGNPEGAATEDTENQTDKGAKGDKKEEKKKTWKDNLGSGLLTGAALLPSMMGGKDGILGSPMTKGSAKTMEGIGKEVHTVYDKEMKTANDKLDKAKKKVAKHNQEILHDAENTAEEQRKKKGMYDPTSKHYHAGFG